MEVEKPGEVLARVEGKFFCGAVLTVFVSFQLCSSPLYLLIFWCNAVGLFCAYMIFRLFPRVPNHLKHLSRDHTQSDLRAPPCVSCHVSNKLGVSNAPHSKKRRDYLNPWDDVTISSSVDSALTEILELTMQRFVYSWHRNLAPGSESMEDEVRVAIHHAAAVLLRRVRNIDLPLLVSRKFLQPIASHIHFYMKASLNFPPDASIASMEAAVVHEYGEHIHSAMKSARGDVCYFRHVARALLPLLLPDNMLQSKIVCSFLEELFANKVLVPAMNIAAKPDFINKLFYNIFDKDSRLEPVFGPPSKDVIFLSKWALARSRQRLEGRPLDIPLPELLDPLHHLHNFIHFMKGQDNVYIMQIYHTLNELKRGVSTFDKSQAQFIIEQVGDLYHNYLIPSAPNYLQLDPLEVAKIETVLSSKDSASSKCEILKKQNVFGRLRGYIYTELLRKIFYPHFLLSHKFYEFYLGSYTEKMDEKMVEENTKSKGHRWKLKLKQLIKISQPSADSHSCDAEARSEVFHGEEGEIGVGFKTWSTPMTIQIVDAKTHTDEMRPYTTYLIMAKQKEADAKYELVNRRFKEFVMLDTKLRQFHGDIHVQLPSKKTFRNMDKTFIENRCKELQQYLGMLLGNPGIQNSLILASFLSPHSDPSLFLPETVAGKMIKAVPSMLKRDKGQHMEDFLQILLQVVEPPSSQPSPKTVHEATAQCKVCSQERDDYLEDIARGSPNQEARPWLLQQQGPLHIENALDLLVFVAVTVYKVPPSQLTLLLLSKLLAQEAAEALIDKFVSRKIELLSTEAHVIRLVHLLRDSIFSSENTPVQEEDIMKRYQQTLEQLLCYPHPFLMWAIGLDRYQQGTSLIIKGLQCRELNKMLLFKLFDLILQELFPELKELGNSG